MAQSLGWRGLQQAGKNSQWPGDPCSAVSARCWVCNQKPTRTPARHFAVGTAAVTDWHSLWGRGGMYCTCQSLCCPLFYCLSHPPENFFSWFFLSCFISVTLGLRQFILPSFLDLVFVCKYHYLQRGLDPGFQILSKWRLCSDQWSS